MGRTVKSHFCQTPGCSKPSLRSWCRSSRRRTSRIPRWRTRWADWERLVRVLLCLELLTSCLKYLLVSSQVLMYNVPGGKRNRGLSVIDSLRELLPPPELTEDLVQRALLVGWCIELVRNALLVSLLGWNEWNLHFSKDKNPFPLYTFSRFILANKAEQLLMHRFRFSQL